MAASTYVSADAGVDRANSGSASAPARNSRTVVRPEVEVVVMESTSDYWRIWYYLLESAGLNVQLVNSRHARQLAGRPKTDQKDAHAKMTCGLQRALQFWLGRPVRPHRIQGYGAGHEGKKLGFFFD